MFELKYSTIDDFFQVILHTDITYCFGFAGLKSYTEVSGKAHNNSVDIHSMKHIIR